MVVTVDTTHYTQSMIGQATFSWYVRQAFTRLHDPSYLIGHPLAVLLANAGIITAPEALREGILDAIAALRPPAGTPPGASTERRWRSLALRHVDGLGFKQIAQQLQVSERQALRDHKEGAEAVAAVLWARYRRQSLVENGPPSENAGSGNLKPAAVSSAPEDLESGLARVSALSDEEATADLNEALRDAIATTRNLSVARGAEIRLPFAERSESVAIEPSILRQILICTLSAALQSGAAVPIDVTTTASGNAVRVEFALRDQKTQPRSSQDARDEVMALVESARRLAQLRGGDLHVSESARGVRQFELRLRAPQRGTVLLIDDNPDLVDLFRWYVAGTDYRIVQARAPSTALKLAREISPDAIILDVMLPSQDGWQILGQLRDDPTTKDIPVIVCSILPERTLALSLGVAYFLPKPVTQESLRAALDQCRNVRHAAEHPDCSASKASSPPH